MSAERYRDGFGSCYDLGVKTAGLFRSSCEEYGSDDLSFGFGLQMAGAIDSRPRIGMMLLSHLLGHNGHGGGQYFAKWMTDGARETVFGSAELPSWWDEQKMSQMMRNAYNSYGRDY